VYKIYTETEVMSWKENMFPYVALKINKDNAEINITVLAQYL
jgi:hypothetical protein